MTRSANFVATCTCGNVELKVIGPPIVSTVCYCVDCQKGSDQIEALSNARAVRAGDGGTAYVLFRNDRVECTKGAEHLRGYKLKETSATNRIVAACCNSPMFMNFDRGPHWVSVYRARFQGEIPPLQLRICTRSKPEGVVLPDDPPKHAGFPPSLILRLLAARVAMVLGR